MFVNVGTAPSIASSPSLTVPAFPSIVSFAEPMKIVEVADSVAAPPDALGIFVSLTFLIVIWEFVTGSTVIAEFSAFSCVTPSSTNTPFRLVPVVPVHEVIWIVCCSPSSVNVTASPPAVSVFSSPPP